MDKESIFELQKIDCNCNDCGYMKRNMDKLPKKGIANPINYGFCLFKEVSVSFIPNICSVENQTCFIHRKEINT